ncbi:MAG TPA: hypothetical protein VK688_01015 [Gemmatimonadales bacterium]|nr:hypothetical protein [Gemmatimonadales bacterium]
MGFHLTEAAKATFSALPAPAPPRRSLSIQSALALLTGASKDLNPTTTAGPTSALPVPRLLVAGVLVVGGLSAGGLGRWVALAGGLLGASAIWTYLQRAPGGNAFVGPQTSAWRPSIATRIVKP